MSARFLKIAVVYFVIGAVVGLYMGITATFTQAPVHAHLNLLGWVSLAVIGLIYHVWPAAGETRLARAHFWLHNLGLPVFMVGLVMVLAGNQAIIPVVAISASVVLLGIVLFAVNLFRTLPAAR